MPIELPDLSLVAAAGFLLIIAAALWLVEILVRNTLGRAPLGIGSWITSHVDRYLLDARNAVFDAAKDSWHAAVQLFNWISDFLWRMFEQVVLTLAEAATTADYIATVRIPQIYRSAQADVNQALLSAAAYAHALYTVTERRIAADIASVRAIIDNSVRSLEYRVTVLQAESLAWADQALRDAEQYGNQLYQLARQDITAEASAVRSLVDSYVAALQADIAQAETEALTIGQNVLGNSQAYARAVGAAIQSGIYTDLEQWGSQALELAWPDAAGDIAGLRRAAGADFPWLNDLAGALSGAGTAGLAGALIRALAGTHAITRLAEDCILPSCRNLSGLVKGIEQLAGAATEAALIEWLVMAVTDPAGWSTETRDVLGPVGRLAVNDARALFGR